MFIIGERINTSRKAVDRAVAERDAATIRAEAESQSAAGADWIDVNAGSRSRSEVDDLCWLIEVIQDALPEARLCIDSPNPDSLRAVLDRVEHPPMFNSTTGEKSRFAAMAPIIQSRECEIVALCMDDRGVPKSTGQILDNAARLVSDLEALGIKRERIYLDPVIQAVSTNGNAGLMVLEAMSRIRRELEGVNVICGLSNISFGLPRRRLVNRAFLTHHESTLLVLSTILVCCLKLVIFD